MDLLNSKKFEIHRTDMSYIALTVFDMMVDIARITGDLEFHVNDVSSLAATVIDFVYKQGDLEEINKDYLLTYVNIDDEVADDMFEDISIEDENYEDFLEIYSLAVVSELILSESVKENNGIMSSTPTETISIHPKVLDLKIKNTSGEINRFGDCVLEERSYCNGHINMFNFTNKSVDINIIYNKLQLTFNADLGMASYVALHSRFGCNDNVEVEHIIQDILKVIESQVD